MPRPARSRRVPHRAVKSGKDPASLHPHEREILQRAVDAGGSYTIEGLPLRDMVKAASAVLELQRVRLVTSTIVFGPSRQPEKIPVEITDAGRRALAAG
jgi:hypothetical protein